MTPEQTTELLKALNQHNWFPVVCGIIWLLGTILQFLIVSRFKSAIENRQHFSRARYDHEVEIYKNLWPKLVNFYRLFSFSDVRNEDDRKTFNIVSQEVQASIRDNKPFFSDEICRELLTFQHLCEDKRFSEIVAISIPLTGDKANSYLELHKQIQSQLEKVEKVIRDRLIKFD